MVVDGAFAKGEWRAWPIGSTFDNSKGLADKTKTRILLRVVMKAIFLLPAGPQNSLESETFWRVGPRSQLVHGHSRNV